MKKFFKWFVVILGGLMVLAMLIFGISIYLAQKATDQMETYKNKAISTEAKISLSALYTAEKIFEIDHGFFTTDLKSIELGWETDDIGPKTYQVGFVSPSKDPKQTDIKTNSSLLFFADREFQDSQVRHPSEQANQYCSDCTATNKHFKAYAFGFLGKQKSLDFWTIDEKNNLIHVLNGTESETKEVH